MRYTEIMANVERKAYQIVVTGSVQGVGFRAFVEHLARKLRISGFVRNAPDYTVEILAEGDQTALELFIEGLKEGNGWSRTDRVSVVETRAQGLAKFTISY